MDDIDAELLALAGDEAAAVVTKQDKLSPPTTNGRKRSEPPTSASPAKTKKSRSAARGGKVHGGRRRRRGEDSSDDDDEEEDESELSAAPESDELSEGEEEQRPVTTRSSSNHNVYASTSEDSDEEHIFELYPFEGTYKDADDKARLMAMSEVEREAVLAERATEIERAMQDRHLRTLLRSQSKAAANAGERAGNTSGGDSGGGGGVTRRSTRTQNMPQAKKLDSKKGKLDEMKRAREERSTRKDKPSSTGGDDDSSTKKRSVVDEFEDEDRANDTNEIYEIKKEEREVDLHDVNRARIGRTGFTKLCDYPGFEETIIDCFVRVSLYDRDTGKNAYRLAQIKGIVQGKPYSLLDGKRRTDKHLQLVQGKAERTFPMDLMSDGNVTESEFTRFKAQLSVDNMPLPPLSLVRRKASDLRALDSRVFTPEEISAMIAKRNKDKIDTVSIVVQRSHLKSKREEAMIIGDVDEVRRLDKELEEVEDMQRKALKGSNAAGADDWQSKLAKHNAAARIRNRKEIREAELEEKRHRAKMAVGDAANPGGEFYNPFQRVRTRAKVIHVDPEVAKKQSQSQNSQSQNSQSLSQTSTTSTTEVTEAVAAATLSGGGGAVGEANIQETVGVPVSQKTSGGRKKGIDDVIASLDIGIEIDI